MLKTESANSDCVLASYTEVEALMLSESVKIPMVSVVSSQATLHNPINVMNEVLNFMFAEDDKCF